MNLKIDTLLMAVVIALGLVAAGYAVGGGIKSMREPVRSVTVKGLAERDVKADFATWTIRYTASDNDLAVVQQQIDAATQTTLTLLQDYGFTPEEITLGSTQVRDAWAERFADAQRPAIRYAMEAGVIINTTAIEKMQRLANATGELIKRGVVLKNDYETPATPSYLFTKLNDIKPAMVAEATKNARLAAQQFAADSAVQVGKLIQADQGYFVIDVRNSAISERFQVDKLVRVVTTMRFEME